MGGTDRKEIAKVYFRKVGRKVKVGNRVECKKIKTGNHVEEAGSTVISAGKGKARHPPPPKPDFQEKRKTNLKKGRRLPDINAKGSLTYSVAPSVF